MPPEVHRMIEAADWEEIVEDVGDVTTMLERLDVIEASMFANDDVSTEAAVEYCHLIYYLTYVARLLPNDDMNGIVIFYKVAGAGAGAEKVKTRE